MLSDAAGPPRQREGRTALEPGGTRWLCAPFSEDPGGREAGPRLAQTGSSPQRIFMIPILYIIYNIPYTIYDISQHAQIPASLSDYRVHLHTSEKIYIEMSRFGAGAIRNLRRLIQ